MMPERIQRPPSSHLRAIAGGKGEERALSDDEICAALQRGDGTVAAKLYDHLIGPVERAIVRVFGRREVDHDDLVQSSFEQIVATLAKRRFARACSLATWASAIATHVSLNALRSRQRERRVLAGMDNDVGADASAAPVDAERRLGARSEVARVRRVLLAMRPDRAEAVWLHDVLGHELAEIAAILGISVAAAQSRLVRGRHELLETLKSDEGHDE